MLQMTGQRRRSGALAANTRDGAVLCARAVSCSRLCSKLITVASVVALAVAAPAGVVIGPAWSVASYRTRQLAGHRRRGDRVPDWSVSRLVPTGPPVAIALSDNSRRSRACASAALLYRTSFSSWPANVDVVVTLAACALGGRDCAAVASGTAPVLQLAAQRRRGSYAHGWFELAPLVPGRPIHQMQQLAGRCGRPAAVARLIP